jgi:hypothetical protein
MNVSIFPEAARTRGRFSISCEPFSGAEEPMLGVLMMIAGLVLKAEEFRANTG